MNIHVIEPLGVSETAMIQFQSRFTTMGHSVTVYQDRTEDANNIIKRCSGADIAVIANIPFPEVVVNALPGLKMLAVAFTGTDHIAIDACKKNGITVCNASGYSSISVAELTVGFIIDLMRNITKLDPTTRIGGTRSAFHGFDIAGKTIGIVGTGDIGLRVAKILSSFDVKLLAYSRSEKEEAHNYGVQYTSLDTLLKESDIITLHVPLSGETRGLIDSGKINLMKKSACIVNCARGPVIRSEDLAVALREKRIAGAALDVFDTEPPLPSDNPFLSLDNVILTPHIAFATEEAFVRRLNIIENNINAFLEGKPVHVIA